MKTSLFIFICLFLLSCTKEPKGTLSEETIKSITSACEANGGVKQVHVRQASYQAVCNNDSKLSVDSVNDGDKIVATRDSSVVLQSELNSCSSLCENNKGVDKIEVERGCTNWVSSGRTSTCQETADSITCHCKNSITKDSKRILTYKNGHYESLSVGSK